MEKMVRTESNIWACILRAVERRGGIHGSNPLLGGDVEGHDEEEQSLNVYRNQDDNNNNSFSSSESVEEEYESGSDEDRDQKVEDFADKAAFEVFKGYNFSDEEEVKEEDDEDDSEGEPASPDKDSFFNRVQQRRSKTLVKNDTPKSTDNVHDRT